MNDFEVATSETDTSLALRCQWETPGGSRFTYTCHVSDGNGPISCRDYYYYFFIIETLQH